MNSFWVVKMILQKNQVQQVTTGYLSSNPGETEIIIPINLKTDLLLI